MKSSENLNLSLPPGAFVELEQRFEHEIQAAVRKLFLEIPLVQRWVAGFEEDFYLWMVLGWRYRHVHLYDLNRLRPYQLCARLFYHIALSRLASQKQEQHRIAYYFCIRALSDLNLMLILLEKPAEMELARCSNPTLSILEDAGN